MSCRSRRRGIWIWHHLKSVPIGKTRFIRSLIMLRNTLRPALRTSKIVIRTSKQSADRGSAVHTHFKNRNAYIVNRTSKRSPPAYQHPQFQRFYHLRRLRAEVAAGHFALFWRDRIRKQRIAIHCPYRRQDIAQWGQLGLPSVCKRPFGQRPGMIPKYEVPFAAAMAKNEERHEELREARGEGERQ